METNKTTRELAIEWWKKFDSNTKEYLFIKYFGRNLFNETIGEIEQIYLAEQKSKCSDDEQWLFRAYISEHMYEMGEYFFERLFNDNTEMKVFSAKHSMEHHITYPEYVSMYWKTSSKDCPEYSITPPTEAVEEAARKQYKNVGYDGSENSISMYISGAKFGAKWQKQQSQTETVDELTKLSETEYLKRIDNYLTCDFKDGIFVGAAWQKEISQTEIDKLKELNRELVEVLDKIFKIFDVKMFKTLIETTLNKAKSK